MPRWRNPPGHQRVRQTNSPSAGPFISVASVFEAARPQELGGYT